MQRGTARSLKLAAGLRNYDACQVVAGADAIGDRLSLDERSEESSDERITGAVGIDDCGLVDFFKFDGLDSGVALSVHS